MTELRYALRRLAAAPGFFVTAVTTLGLGIGVTTLMFSAVHGLLVRPLPFANSERIGWIMAHPPSGEPGGISSDEANALLARAPALERLAVIGDMGLVREVGNRHDRWHGIWATRGLVDVLGVRLAAGAVPARPSRDGARPILIAQERWQQDFGGDPSLVGREIAFADNKRFIVVGVLPAGLEFPFARAPQQGNGSGFVTGRQDFWVLQPDEAGAMPGGFAVARVREGVATGTAAAQATAISDRRPDSDRRTITFTPLRDYVLGDLAAALPVLQMFGVLVFLIACGNLGTLLLARAVAQRDEVALRVALGARPAALTRTFATDAALLCGAGAALGLAIAAAGRALILRLAPRHEAIVDRIAIDSTTVLFISAVGLLTTLAFGVIPGWLRARAAVAEAPRASTRTTSPGVQLAFRGLVVAQVALSLLLLVGSVALRDSFQRIMRVDAGYDMRGVVAADVLLFLPAKEALPLIDRFVTRLRETSGIEAVGLVQSTPLTGKWTFEEPFEVLDGPQPVQTPPISGGFVGYDYFRAMGVPLVAGRTFTHAEFTSSRQRVMIVNDVAARMFFPDAQALGARIRMNNRIYEVVGVVKGTRDARLDTAAEPQWYQPAVLGSSQVIVRGTASPAATAALVRQILHAADPRIIVERVEPLETIASESVIERRLASQLVSGFAAIAVVLAGIGLYGVVHFAAARRQREFGIRMAIGARPSDVLVMVVRQGVMMAVAGVALGALLSLSAGGMLESLLFEARAAEPSALLYASLTLIAVAAAASLRPGWRAASVDPATTLRAE